MTHSFPTRRASDRQERLQDVPISITAISAEKIESAQISQGSDLIRLVPTLNVQQSSTGPGQSYSLRGIRTGVITYFNEVPTPRSEEHTSELQSLMRISYAVFCLTKKDHETY